VADITFSIDKLFLLCAVFSLLDNTKFGFVMTVRMQTTVVSRADTSVVGGHIADMSRAVSKASFTLGFRNPIREVDSRMGFKKVSRFIPLGG
jgi:hypothetical protein